VSSLDFDVSCDGSGQGNFHSIFFHSLEVEFDCLFDESFRLLDRFTHGDTSRKIKHKSSVSCITFLDDDGVPHISHFQPASDKRIQRFARETHESTRKIKVVLDSGISFASIPVFTSATSFLVLRILSLRLIRVIGGIRGALLLLSISVYSCPFVVSFLRLDLVGPEE
jgi:hypothetical protein